MTQIGYIPEGCHTPTPYLTFRGAAQAIDFYKTVFGASEVFRLTNPDGRIGHAEIAVGDSRIMLADEAPDFGALSPQTVGGSPIKLHLYVEDADRTVERAVKAGATLLRPVDDQFYGDRGGLISDPFGYSWFIATHKEEVSPEEMQRRWAAVFENAG
ncbi:MAG TPA: VOC family protein [Blastocatellia bacterium]|nr:VOC family protein [Blastocatellia bacterium]